MFVYGIIYGPASDYWIVNMRYIKIITGLKKANAASELSVTIASMGRLEKNSSEIKIPYKEGRKRHCCTKGNEQEIS